MSLCHDLNDELILKWQMYLLALICIDDIRTCSLKPRYLNGGPSLSSLLPSVLSSLQLLQDFVVEHLQLLMQASQLFL